MLSWLDAATATWPEVADYLRRIPAAIWPLGATEQHGPHLPLATDTILATALAERIAAQSAGLVLPALPVGYSWVWRDFPGTLTWELETFRAAIRDGVRNLARQGVRAALLLSGHGANQAPLKYVARELGDDPVAAGTAVLYLCYEGVDALDPVPGSERWHGDFHAEEIETSLMLTVRPDLCRMDLAVGEYPAIPPEYGRSARSMGTLSKSGVFGDATVASAAKGEAWLGQLAAAGAARWRAFLETQGIPVPPRP